MCHPDPNVRNLLNACPALASRVDLAEGANYVMGQVAFLLRDKTLEHSDERCVYSYLGTLADGDIEAQNLLVVNVLEVLADTPEGISSARRHLSGAALALFERVLQGWQ